MRLSFRTEMPFKPFSPTLFVEHINSGFKKHTLREDPKKRWRKGLSIEMVTGSRFKPNIFNEKHECLGVQEVEIELRHDDNFPLGFELEIIVDGEELRGIELIKFIQNDGFDSLSNFAKWFFPDYKEGKINLRCIHWTELMY
jgi:hypothetical protein